jgi:hypothetical protein
LPQYTRPRSDAEIATLFIQLERNAQNLGERLVNQNEKRAVGVTNFTAGQRIKG